MVENLAGGHGLVKTEQEIDSLDASSFLSGRWRLLVYGVINTETLWITLEILSCFFLRLAVDLVSDLMKLNLGQEDGRHDRSG